MKVSTTTYVTALSLVLMFFAAALVFNSTTIYAQSTGSIAGRVTDGKDNTPLQGAIVKIEGTNMGAETDANGEFTILNIQVGTYNVIATYVGYDASKQTSVKVSVDLKTKIEFVMSTTGGIRVDTVEIVAKRKGIDVDQSGRNIDKTQIENTGIRGIQNLVSKTAGVVEATDATGKNNIYIRGGRSSENLIIVDGVATTNPQSGNSSAFVPNSLLQEIAVLTGGFGAEYGNALSGVINVSTSNGTNKYSGSAEVISDVIAGKWNNTINQGYNLYNVTLGGPLIPIKSLSKVINFFGSVERQYLQVKNPSWVSDQLFSDGVIPNYSQKLWSYSGKLSINLNEIKGSKVPVQLRFGALISDDQQRTFRMSFLKNNNDRNPIVKTNNYQYYARISHNISSKFFYELQGSYYRSKDETSDIVFGSNLFRYGDTNYVPGLNTSTPLVQQNSQGTTLPSDPTGLFASHGAVHNQYILNDISYLGGKLDATWAVNTKKLGDHELKFGGEFRYHTLKKESLNPVGTMINSRDSLTGLLILDPQKLWYGRDVLLNSYGYDVRDQWGNQIVTGDDINAKHPIIAAAYIRDKVDFSNFTLNLGVRLDYLNVKTNVLKDPNVTVDPSGNILSDALFEPSKANITVSPRLGFSFPVTDKTIFVANFGKFIQMPALNYLYINKQSFQQFFSTSLQNIAEYSGLKPEKLTSYEVGFKHQVGDYLNLGLTAYYKETKDQIGVQRIDASATNPQGYILYGNTDFSISRGLDFYMSLRRTNHVAVDISYTLLYASGTGSDPNQKFGLANNPGAELPKFTFPLDYDQRHSGSINIDYRYGNDDVPKGFLGSILKNFGINGLFTFNSGRPYTARALPQNGLSTGAVSDDGTALSTKNAVYTPWTLRFDLKIDKGLKIANKISAELYLYVINLFNSEIINTVYGSTGLPNDNGYLNTPTGSTASQEYVNNYKIRENNINNWGTPRQIRLGLKVGF